MTPIKRAVIESVILELGINQLGSTIAPNHIITIQSLLFDKTLTLYIISQFDPWSSHKGIM